MKLIEELLPPGYRFRELWLPQNIIPNSSLLRSVRGGHDLALTGALLGSTVNGLEMRGAERITITDHADIHITDDLTVVLPAFVLTGTFPDDYAANMGLMNLNNGAVIARLNQATGALDIIFNNVDGGADETVSTTKVSWAADTLWQVAFTFANNGTGVISIRLYINGVAENTNDQVDGPIVVPAGNTVLGEDLTTFFTGKFQRMFLVYDTAILTEAQLLEVYKGIPYATNLQAYIPLDHPGRALTMPDRSVGGNCNGTISGTAIGEEIWDFGQVKQAVINFDGINDHAQSPAGVDISGDLTLFWVGKMRSTYDGLTGSTRLIHFYATAGNNTIGIDMNFPTNSTRFGVGTLVGGFAPIFYTPRPAIGDYQILLLTLDAVSIAAYVNGILAATDAAPGIMPFVSATGYLSKWADATGYDVSKVLLAGLIEGALSHKDAIAFSRRVKNMYNLPI